MKVRYLGARSGKPLPRIVYILTFGYPLVVFSIAGLIILGIELIRR